MRLRLLAVPMTALGLVVPGCGSGTTTEEQRAADQALADRVVLQLSDFPDGWEVSSPDEGADSGFDPFALEDSCADLVAVRDTVVEVLVQSPDFERETADTYAMASAFVRVPWTVDDATEYVAAFASSGECLETVLRGSMQEAADDASSPFGFDVVDVVSSRPLVERRADETIRQEVAITVEMDLLGELTYSFDFTVVRSGRFIVGLYTMTMGEPLPEHDALLDAMIDRLLGTSSTPIA
jgi:hypothetical protein